MRYLPSLIASVLDVGCGNGFPALMLGLEHGTREFHLLDGDDQDLGRKCVGYSRTATKPWRSPRKAAERIKGRLPDAVVKTYTPLDPWPRHVGLIMSLWSWGFHYPVETYLDKAATIKAPLLIDLRQDTARQAIKVVKAAGYRSYIVVDASRKAQRVFFHV